MRVFETTQLIISTMKVTYSNELTSLVLDAFNKTVDEEGYVVEKNNTSQRVLTQDGKQIPVKFFGGIKKGSELYVSSDLPSIMELCKYLAKKKS